MKVKKFFKEWSRMCESMGEDEDACEKCLGKKLKKFTCCAYEISDDDTDIIINEIEKWSKEHPRKTYKDVFLEKFPQAPLSKYEIPRACVTMIFGDTHFRNEKGDCIEKCCIDCWDREYKGEMNDE